MSEDTQPKRAVDAEDSAVSAPETTAAPEATATEATAIGTAASGTTVAEATVPAVAAPAAETPKAVAPAPAAPAKTLSLKLSTLGLAAAAVVLIGALVTVSTLWLSARSDLSDRDAKAAAEQHAEQVATDYSVGASNINFSDLNSWTGRLKANTTPALGNKFDATAPKLQEILVPLKWTSSATPVAAKVVGHDNGLYQVDVFLNVTSTNAQNPDGAQTTVTYNVTVDPNNGWKVSDVGGTALALPKQ
ncbi:MAG: hypothetical protein JWN03_2934 [Nocardia sp.]|uniref:hypothetical protein n=1 Tax=Nocardia sp. TaxID=1821 RepID=UPI00260DB049|nr:hypothetical protein [Nocardia sp.]MCU1642659.1 hypothetical protein [Nocardia sp.]